MKQNGERRRHPRYRLTVTGRGAHVTLPARWSKKTHAFEVTSGDVSLGGMQVHFHERVKPGDRLRLRFPFSRFRRMSLDSLVRWSKRGASA